MFRVKPGLIIITIVLMLLVGLSEGIGLLCLLPLLALAGIPIAHQPAWSHALSQHFYHLSVVGVLGLFLLLLIGVASLQYLLAIRSARLVQDTASRVRRQLFEHALGANWAWMRGQSTARLTQMLSVQVDSVSVCLQQGLQLLSQSILVLVYVVVSALMLKTIGLLVLLGGAVAFFLQRKVVSWIVEKSTAMMAAREQMMACTIAASEGLKVLKGMHAEAPALKQFSGWVAGIAEASTSVYRAIAARTFWHRMMMALCVAGFTAMSLVWHWMSMAHWMVLLLMFSRITPKFSSLTQSCQQLMHQWPRVKNVMAWLEESAAYQELIRDRATLSFTEGIRFCSVSFSYSSFVDPAVKPQDDESHLSSRGSTMGSTPQSTFQISNCSFTIPVNQLTLIRGESGVGKSTVLDMLMGLLTPSAGKILIDDTMLTADSMHVWRSRLAFVPQEAAFFPGTLRENLLQFVPDVSDCALREAIVQARAEFVFRLPEGLNSSLSERGKHFSFGERQRLSLARALLRNPQLLLLDEVSNGLDPANTAALMKTLVDLSARMTIVMVTHETGLSAYAHHVITLDRSRPLCTATTSLV